MADRIGWQTVVLVPLARPLMPGRYLIRLFLYPVRLEHVCEEMVIAIPMALAVQRNYKQVASLQGFQQHFAFFSVGDGVAQRAA